MRLCLRYCVVSAHCLNHDLTASPMTEEESKAYLQQCWEELTVEKVPVARINKSFVPLIGSLLLIYISLLYIYIWAEVKTLSKKI